MIKRGIESCSWSDILAISCNDRAARLGPFLSVFDIDYGMIAIGDTQRV